MDIDILQCKRDNHWWAVTTEEIKSSWCECPECGYTVKIYGCHYEGVIVECPHDNCKSWFILGEEDLSWLESMRKWWTQKGGPRIIIEERIDPTW